MSLTVYKSSHHSSTHMHCLGNGTCFYGCPIHPSLTTPSELRDPPQVPALALPAHKGKAYATGPVTTRLDIGSPHRRGHRHVLILGLSIRGSKSTDSRTHCTLATSPRWQHCRQQHVIETVTLLTWPPTGHHMDTTPPTRTCRSPHMPRQIH